MVPVVDVDGGLFELSVAPLAALPALAEQPACRGETVTKSLAESASRERERQGAEPRSLLVVDGVTPDTDLDALLPTREHNGADVFVVTSERTGRIDDVVEVATVPEQAPLQPTNVEPGPGVAVSVTAWPWR